jgi:hypothetical protein
MFDRQCGLFVLDFNNLGGLHEYKEVDDISILLAYLDKRDVDGDG